MRLVVDIKEQGVVEVADERIGRSIGEGQGVAPDHPLDGDNGHRDHAEKDQADGVLAAGHSAVEVADARRHYEDQGAGYKDPGSIAATELFYRYRHNKYTKLAKCPFGCLYMKTAPPQQHFVAGGTNRDTIYHFVQSACRILAIDLCKIWPKRTSENFPYQNLISNLMPGISSHIWHALPFWPAFSVHVLPEVWVPVSSLAQPNT